MREMILIDYSAILWSSSTVGEPSFAKQMKTEISYGKSMC